VGILKIKDYSSTQRKAVNLVFGSLEFWKLNIICYLMLDIWCFYTLTLPTNIYLKITRLDYEKIYF